MFGPHAAVDRIKEVMGAANLQSTAERKVCTCHAVVLASM